MFRRIRYTVLFSMLAVLSCSNPPMKYIPTADRSMLEAEARLGQDGNGGAPGGISVGQLLDQVRRGEAAPEAAQAAFVPAGTPSRVLLRFAGEAVQPDAVQRSQLDAFASAHGGGDPVQVTSRADGIEAGAKLLGQRRAVAVSRALTGTLADVSIRFDPDMPDGMVVVSAGVAAAAEP